MTARDYALAIVTSETLEGKLVRRRPTSSSRTRDRRCGSPRPGARPRSRSCPGAQRARCRRSPACAIRSSARGSSTRSRTTSCRRSSCSRGRCSRIPSAPLAFRRGLVAILADEQRHLGLYRERLAAHGVAFGDHPVTGHFWNKLDHLTGPLEFVCAMGLTFENANLDFAGDYAAAARACGDEATAAALDQVHADEIGHVHFGWVWLKRLAGDVDPWQAYLDHVRSRSGRAARAARGSIARPAAAPASTRRSSTRSRRSIRRGRAASRAERPASRGYHRPDARGLVRCRPWRCPRS